MGGSAVLFLIQNVFIFCLLFWLLTFIGEYFFKNKNQKSKKNFYECGFKSTVDLNIQTNFNFVMYVIFLILYDVEFLFLIPFFINVSWIDSTSIYVLIVFGGFIVLSLIIDFLTNGLKWKI